MLHLTGHRHLGLEHRSQSRSSTVFRRSFITLRERAIQGWTPWRSSDVQLKPTQGLGFFSNLMWLLIAGVIFIDHECFFPRIATADEGMIPMSELANVDLVKRGIELTVNELFNAEAVSLVDGVCRVNGCTGSFVSSQGLIITNHHCAYGAIHSEIAAAAPFEINFDQLRSASRAVAFGFMIYDAAVERQKADLDREPDYMDRNWVQTVQRLKTSMADYHAPTEKKMLAGMLQRLSKLPASHSNDALSQWIKQPSDIEAQANRLIEQTSLGDLAFVESCLEKTPDELAKIDDAVLQWVVDLYPRYIEMRETDKARDGRLSQFYGSLIEVKQQFLATRFIPDANGTLRLTSGKIRSYSPEDAILKKPITTLTGVLDKTTGIEPFVTPQAVLDKYRAGDFGSFRNEQIGDVPVAILYDTDTTGGNSGSPVLNARGELVGVNFDRCFEATINDFAWNASYSRSIGVDIRYVLWITGIVYGADALLKEMGVH